MCIRDSGYALVRTHLCHPFTQGGNGDLAPDDDCGQYGIQPAKLNEHDQRCGNDQFVSDRIEKLSLIHI